MKESKWKGSWDGFGGDPDNPFPLVAKGFKSILWPLVIGILSAGAFWVIFVVLMIVIAKLLIK